MRIPEAGGRSLNQEIEFGFGSSVRAVWLQVGNAVFFSRGASPSPFSLFPFRFRAITCPFSLAPVYTPLSAQPLERCHTVGREKRRAGYRLKWLIG